MMQFSRALVLRRHSSTIGVMLAVAAVIAALAVAIRPASAAGTFNGAGVTVPGGAATTSNIVVAGQDTVTDVNVVLNNFTTNFAQVADVVLESPSGAKVTLLSDVACSASPTTNVTFGIDDAAQTPFPGAGAGAASPPIVNGTIYQPTDLDVGATPCDGSGDGLVPAPTGTTLAAFNGSNPNGTWKLHFASDSGGTSASISGWSLSLSTPTNGCDSKLATIVGTDGSNKIRGTAGDDVIVAGGGKDNVKGLGGNDTICGSAGKDVLKGGAGNDRIFGESGKDQLKGSSGVDVCFGGSSKDSFSGCETRVQ